ncbi:MAG: hypothetical protein P8Y10_07675, partial [Gemmatimonadales bacterium]
RAWFSLLFSTHDMDEGGSAVRETRPAQFTGESVPVGGGPAAAGSRWALCAKTAGSKRPD